MIKPKSKFSVLAASLLCATLAFSQDNAALVDALIRKGILSDQEAEEIRADLSRDWAASLPLSAGAGSKEATKLTLGARLQIQFAGLGTDIENAADPAGTSHFFLRRVYLVTKANFGSSWSLNITYDAAESLFDAAMLQYKSGATTVDVGLRKAPLGFEELTSSGSLKAIERSGVTRYFAETNNGRRLGAAGYRVGVFADGSIGNFFYAAAVTNPERVETATFAGAASNNSPALWVHGGYRGKFDRGSFMLGTAAASLPDQGGMTAGTGNDLLVWSLFGELTFGNLQVAGEYLAAEMERGASMTRDASPSGYWVQGSLKLTPVLEAVARFSALDSDGRGVNLSDAVRSAPSGGTMDQLSELFVGGNWYIKGNDLKLQAGFVHGESEDTVTGAAARAKATGFRSQMQFNF